MVKIPVLHYIELTEDFNPDDYTNANHNPDAHADANAYIHPNTHIDAKPNGN